MSPLVFHWSNMPGGGYSLILAIHTEVCAAPKARVLGLFGLKTGIHFAHLVWNRV